MRNVLYMETTTYAQTFRPNHVAAIVERNGQRLGHVVMRGRKFTATRKAGSTNDLRRFADGFHTAQAAAAWIAR